MSMKLEPFSYRLHSHLRSAYEPHTGDTPSATPPQKEYPRMPRFHLPLPPLSASLAEVLEKRVSRRELDVRATLTPEEIGALLGHALGAREEKKRRYPSGGALYPIEIYVLTSRVDAIQSGVHHYNVSAHALEHLWGIPAGTDIFASHERNAWARDAAAVIIFTGIWRRNYQKYGDAGYLLAMLETGHMAQNVLLVAEACKLCACPLNGFNDDATRALLDLDYWEQPVYTIALGKRKEKE